jgi:hypothetical protein
LTKLSKEEQVNGKQVFKVLTLIGFIGILWGCTNSSEKKQERAQPKKAVLSEKPSRKAYDGFEWEKVSGAGIEFWAQRNNALQVGISKTLPGAFIENIENGKTVAIGLAIQVFELKNQKIEDVFEYLKTSKGWNDKESCAFTKIKSTRQGVDRYMLMPTGKALREYEAQSSSEPICTTCSGWGMGNSGSRYFEIHHNNRSKALFIEIGQEFPLFDEETIVVK